MTFRVFPAHMAFDGRIPSLVIRWDLFAIRRDRLSSCCAGKGTRILFFFFWSVSASLNFRVHLIVSPWLVDFYRDLILD